MFSFKKFTESKHGNVSLTSDKRTLLLAYFYEYNSEIKRFIKEQETSRLLRSSGIKTPPNNIPVLQNILF